MQAKLQGLAEELGERLLHCPRNPISMALTVDSFERVLKKQQQRNESNNDQDDLGGEDAAAEGGLHEVHQHPTQKQEDIHVNMIQFTHKCKGCQDAKELTVSDGEQHCFEDCIATASKCKGSASQEGCPKKALQTSSATMLGAMLWQRHVSGVRVICRHKRQSVAGIEFEGYGSSCNEYPHDYMTAAAALGVSREDVDVFVDKVKKCWMSKNA
jgi:hypothetical protein